MFGHLTKDNTLIFAQFPIRIDGADYFTTDKNILLKAGEKEIIYSSSPEAELGTYYVSSWKETATTLEQIWTLVTTEKEAILRKTYEKSTEKYIAEKYSPSDETKVTREYLAYGDAYKTAFDEYNSYVESCKDKAYLEVYGINRIN